MSKYRNSDTKTGMWFSYDPGDGLQMHDNEADARSRAEEAFEFYKSESIEGWDEEVEQVCWGKCSQKVEMLWNKERPPEDRLDESNCDKDGLCWAEWGTMRDYALMPQIKEASK